MLRLAAFFSFFVYGLTQSCIGPLLHSVTGICPSGQGIPDCSHIQNSAGTICNTMLNGYELVNAKNCSLSGSLAGCQSSFVANTTDVFCCVLATVTEQNVQNLDRLREYPVWYGIFSGLGLITILLGAYVINVDVAATQKYISVLLKNNVVRQLLSHQINDPIYVYDERSTLAATERRRGATTIVVEPIVNQINLFQRILIQHSRLGFLFRFDPRLSRLFRLLFLLVIQFHSLFITALFYGILHDGRSMGLTDTIVLAVLTTALNLPVVKILLLVMNKIGNAEFKFVFPLLYSEYSRRIEFERIALIYFQKLKNPEFENLNQVFLEEEQELLGKTDRELLRDLGTVIRQEYPYVERYTSCFKYFPAHTWRGWLFILSCFAWAGWCLNYLLLFASSHNQTIGEQVLTSYAISEIANVILIQPLTIGATIFFYWFVNSCGKCIPRRIQNCFKKGSVDEIPSLYYFSVPWRKKSQTSFTAEFSYNILIRAAAAASNVNEMAYAPNGAIATMIGGDGEILVDGRARAISELYERLWAGWITLRHH